MLDFVPDKHGDSPKSSSGILTRSRARKLNLAVGEQDHSPKKISSKGRSDLGGGEQGLAEVICSKRRIDVGCGEQGLAEVICSKRRIDVGCGEQGSAGVSSEKRKVQGPVKKRNVIYTALGIYSSDGININTGLPPAEQAKMSGESESAGVITKKSTTIVGRVLRKGHGAPGTLASRPLRPIYTPYPENGSSKAVDKWCKESHRIAMLVKSQAPLRKLTLRLVRDDRATAAALPTPEHKNMVLCMSRSIVFISSPPPEGKLFHPRTGIVIRWDGDNKCAMVLTTYTAYFRNELHEPQPKLCVHLPDKSIVEGRLIFVNPHYSIAILEITSDLPLQVPTFCYGAKYGQDILALSRDKNMCLMARRGTISWSDGSSMWRNHYMYVDCDVPKGGKGGLVVDNGGSPVGMVYDEGPRAAIISMSTALSCIGMWEQFRCVARPVFKMDLTTVQLLGVSIREELSIKHNINDGFIVKDVDDDSDLERLGIRTGDVIFFQDECGSTLPEIDRYLLSLGWKYLRGMRSMVLKLEVHDIEGPARETITVPLEFCVDSAEVPQSRSAWRRS